MQDGRGVARCIIDAAVGLCHPRPHIIGHISRRLLIRIWMLALGRQGGTRFLESRCRS